LAKKVKHYGEYAFLAGIFIALLVAVLSQQIPDENRPLIIAVLAVLGIVVGASNIQEKESPVFLVAAIALLLAASSWTPLINVLSVLGELGDILVIWTANFIDNLVAFVSPAAFVVALKRIYHLARG